MRTPTKCINIDRKYYNLLINKSMEKIDTYLAFLLKDFLQYLHWKPCSPVWWNIWARNWVAWMNELPQILHLWGLSPVWIFTWRLRVSLAENRAEHCKNQINVNFLRGEKSSEILPHRLALVGLLSRVHPPVLPEGPIWWKSLWAEIASKRLLARVRTNMNIEQR